MVTLIRDTDRALDALLITPYIPLSGRGSLVVLLIVWTPILSVAGVCGLLGNWYVLPFSFGVCVVLGLAFRSAHRCTQIREVVSFSAAQVSIERVQCHVEHRCSLPRADATVLLQAGPDGDVQHLFICSQDHKIEVGDFLDQFERHKLAFRLGELIH